MRRGLEPRKAIQWGLGSSGERLHGLDADDGRDRGDFEASPGTPWYCLTAATSSRPEICSATLMAKLSAAAFEAIRAHDAKIFELYGITPAKVEIAKARKIEIRTTALARISHTTECIGVPEGAPAPALGERSGAPSGLRRSSFVMWNTPVEFNLPQPGVSIIRAAPHKMLRLLLDGHA
jgi:hypothetical protein